MIENILKPHPTAMVADRPTVYYWLDGDIIHFVTKPVPPVIEETRKVLDEFRKLKNGEKVCMLLDITNSQPVTSDYRQFIAEEYPKVVKAMAILSKSVTGRILANLFFAIKPAPYPAKMFDNETAAKDWLKQYL